MASEKWAGFTDEDIVRIKTSPSMASNRNKNNINTVGSPHENRNPMRLNDVSSGDSFQQSDFLSDTSKEETSDSDPDVDQKQRHRPKKNSKGKENDPVSEGLLNESEQGGWENNGNDLSDDSCISSDMSKRENEDKSFDSNTSIQELELFELRQKRVEAENARRRALINKAITDKKMQTQAEAMKLAKITQELKHLDSILSADVSILRDYIEKATAEFSEAEKRYLKSEHEFIEAKLNLYEKLQRKEQLTEHLCSIIEQNENRKADKLVELMKQLEMDSLVEEYQEANEQPILSKFCLLNDEAYHCCTTLKPPSSRETLVEAPSAPSLKVEPNHKDISENTEYDVTQEPTLGVIHV